MTTNDEELGRLALKLIEMWEKQKSIPFTASEKKEYDETLDAYYQAGGKHEGPLHTRH